MSTAPAARREACGLAAAVAVAVGLGLAATIGMLLLTGGAPRPAPAGLPDAGRLTGWSLPVLRLLLDVAAVVTIGATLVACLGDAGRPRALRAAKVSAAGWLLVAAGNAVVTVSDLAGVPLTDVRPVSGARLLLQVPQGRALVVMVLAAAVVVWGTGRAASRLGVATLLAVAVLGLASLAQTGHAGTTSHHYLATQALVVHVVGASLWIGGLGALLVLPRGEALAAAAEPYSRIALGCFVAVAVSGLASAWLRIGADQASWRSAYGAVLAAKVVLVIGLGIVGAWHRRRTMPALRTGDRRPFARLARLELLWMALAVGLGVALARSPLPPAAADRVRPVHAAAVATVDPQLPAPTWAALLVRTRPDALVVTGLAVAVVGLVVWRSRAVRRPVPLALGLLLVAWCLVGGLAAYSAALPQTQVAQLLVLGLLAAPLLAHGSRLPAGQSPARGLVGLLLVLGVLSSRMLDATLGSPLLHLALAVAALGAGLLFFGPVLSREPEHRGDAATTSVVLAVVLGCHGVLVVGGGLPLAGGWFGRLGQAGADPARDQTVAGILLLVAAAAVAGLSLLLRQGARVQPAPHLDTPHHERVGVGLRTQSVGPVRPGAGRPAGGSSSASGAPPGRRGR